MGARFEALDEGVLMAHLNSRYTQFGFKSISVQVCASNPDDKSFPYLDFDIELSTVNLCEWDMENVPFSMR